MNPYIIGGVAIAAFSSGWLVNGWRYQAEIEKINAENSLAVAKATQEAMTESARLQGIKDEALKKANARAQQNAAAAATARLERDGLRDDLSAATSALSNATCDATRQYAATVSTLFDQCATSLEGLAKNADGHATDAETLSTAWPK